MAIFHFAWKGHLVSTNEWIKTRIMKNPAYRPGMSIYKMFIATIYQTTKYKNFKVSLANAMRGVSFEGYVDLKLCVSMWRVKDTDAPLKAVMDAIELAGVIKNDRYIRDIKIVRAYHKKNEPDTLVIDLYRTKQRDCAWAGQDELQFYGDKE